MPQPGLPPTPASSLDLKAQDGPIPLQVAFELPPPALSTVNESKPPSPTARRRAGAGKEAFALPPPPTRSRKIIQMKPRGPADEVAKPVKSPPKDAAKDAAKDAPKKKQPSSTSAAGRKIARKTAHSLIERRRRSKMNEEFGILKNMIPACTGDMHKLAILQASIDYIRYLEDCVSKLKANSTECSTFLPEPYSDGDDDEDDDEDTPMSNSDVSPVYSRLARVHQPSVSPALLPQSEARDRQGSCSSTTSYSHQRHYSYSTASASTSPAFGPQRTSLQPLPGSAYFEYSRGGSVGTPVSALTSPALAPVPESVTDRDREREQDHEATAALLMLNNDRRGTLSSVSPNIPATAMPNGRGMSVMDLLSS